MYKRPVVMVVDDEVVYTDVIRLVLEDYGVEVEMAHSVDEAMCLINKTWPEEKAVGPGVDNNGTIFVAGLVESADFELVADHSGRIVDSSYNGDFDCKFA